MPPEIRQLIREMSIANPLWGAPRIHGELLKLGIDVGQTSVAKYMVRRRGRRRRAGRRSCATTHMGSRRWICLSFRPSLPTALRTADHGARPATNPVAWRHSAPDGGMDRQPTDGGLWLGATPSLSDPRSGCLLRRHIRPTRSLAWYSRSSDLCTFTLAERICGAFDRLDPPGMPRPYCCDRRATPAPHPHVLYGVLQRRPNASLLRQGCASSKAHSTHRAHPSEARSWRAAPSIRTDLIFGTHRLLPPEEFAASAYFLGMRFDPTILIGALAAIIGGVVVFGSNLATSKQTMAAMKDAEAKRTELIGLIDLRTVGASRNGVQHVDS